MFNSPKIFYMQKLCSCSASTQSPAKREIFPKPWALKIWAASLNSSWASGVWQIVFHSVCAGRFPQSHSGNRAISIPFPRAPAPICCCLGSEPSKGCRGKVSPLLPVGASGHTRALTPFPCHPLTCWPAALLSAQNLGVSWLLIFDAMSQRPWAKGI